MFEGSQGFGPTWSRLMSNPCSSTDGCTPRARSWSQMLPLVSDVLSLERLALTHFLWQHPRPSGREFAQEYQGGLGTQVYLSKGSAAL